MRVPWRVFGESFGRETPHAATAESERRAHPPVLRSLPAPASTDAHARVVGHTADDEGRNLSLYARSLGQAPAGTFPSEGEWKKKERKM